PRRGGDSHPRPRQGQSARRTAGRAGDRRPDRRLDQRHVAVDAKGGGMPPRGVKKGTKLARQYEHIKESERKQGRSTSRAKEIAARTVNKERARTGQAKSSSRLSKTDMSSGRRGGMRSGTDRPKGRTYEQLYNEARRMGIEGRSSMNKAQLERAVDGRK